LNRVFSLLFDPGNLTRVIRPGLNGPRYSAQS
jgi:hypothetical protein